MRSRASRERFELGAPCATRDGRTRSRDGAIFQAAVIGVIQGLTEFLPISSSAHLIVVPPLLGWDDAFLNSAAFDVMLHAGTLGALLAYFWRGRGCGSAGGSAALRDRSLRAIRTGGWRRG